MFPDAAERRPSPKMKDVPMNTGAFAQRLLAALGLEVAAVDEHGCETFKRQSVLGIEPVR